MFSADSNATVESQASQLPGRMHPICSFVSGSWTEASGYFSRHGKWEDCAYRIECITCEAEDNDCQVVFTQLIDRIPPLSQNATQTLVLAHRRELVEQAAKHCTSAYPDKRVEIEMGPMQASGTADITIASVQSITSKDRLDKFDPSRFKLVLVDEAHHAVAPGYLRVLSHFGLEQKNEKSPSLIGVSATFSRFDGLKLGAAFDEIVYHKDYVEMIGEQWLSDVVFTTVESKADISRVRSGTNGDFATGELSRAVNTADVNEITVRSWLAHAGCRKSTLVFCVDLDHVSSLTKKFREHGQDARFITGDTPLVERTNCLNGFRNREFPVLVNCGVFTEGTDIPNIDCVVLARPTKSRNLLVQMIGRGMRLHPDKRNCHVIDMVSSLDTGIVTTPTLFGLDPGEVLEKASASDLRSLKDRKEAEELRETEAYATANERSPSSLSASTKITFTQYSSVLDLIADTSGEKHIRRISQNAWVQVGKDRFVLCAPSGSFIRIECALDKITSKPSYRAVEVRALPKGVAKSPYAAPKELLKAVTFADAVHGSDNYAASNYPRVFIHRYQRWRGEPPTDGQLKFINKFRGDRESLTAAEITKGKATDMITKIRHGARGQFSDIMAENRRKERHVVRMESDIDKKRREHVSVGPILH